MALTKITTGLIADNAVTSSQIVDATIVTGDIAATTIATSNMAVDPTNASNLSSGSVPLAQLGNAPSTDLTPVEDDIAILGFKVASNGSLAKYNLDDQTVDAFETSAGIDASASTDEVYGTKSWSGTIVGSYSITAFTSTGAQTWTCPANTSTVEVLMVAGGGGGANPYRGGGGGAGGIVHDTSYPTVPAVVYDLTVGTGGPATTTGADTTWNDNAEGSGTKYTAKGGGGSSGQNNYTGGSGGGIWGQPASPGAGNASIQQSSGTATGGTVTSYGFAGGDSPSEGGGTGGGGASEKGRSTSNSPLLPPGRPGTYGGWGGDGQEFSQFDAYGTDSSNTSGATPGSGSGKGWFGGGGGGAGYTHASPSTNDPFGGVGGGGYAGHYNPNRGSQSGFVNTGGGGGGSPHDGTSGSGGGTGILLLKHRPLQYQNMTLVSVATTAVAVPTKGDMVLTWTDGAGSNTLNTDIRAYVTRDNGTTYTQGTLLNQGTTGGHNIASFHDLVISGQPSGSEMRYKIETLNQTTSKWAAIQAVSLGWS